MNMTVPVVKTAAVNPQRKRSSAYTVFRRKQRIGIAFVIPILVLVMITLMDGGVSVDPATGVETGMEAFGKWLHSMRGSCICSCLSRLFSQEYYSVANRCGLAIPFSCRQD